MSSWSGQAARAKVPSRLPRFAETAVERARLTVVPRQRKAAPRVPFLVLVAVVLLGGVVGLLLFNTSMQQAAFATTALEEQARTLTAREQTLKMELDVLRNPQRVAEQAQRMGMVPAHNAAYLQLPSGKVLGEPAPAQPVDDLRLRPRPPAKPAVLDPEPVVRAAAGTAARTSGDRSTDRDRD